MKRINLHYEIDMEHTKFADCIEEEKNALITVEFNYPESILFHHTEAEVQEFFKWYLEFSLKNIK